MDLKCEIFDPVAARIRLRIDSLRNIKRFPRTGIEAWFKVEIVAALGQIVRSLNNKGPDLLLDDGSIQGLQIEIKAANDFNPSWCFLDPVRKYGCPCFFLCDGTDPKKLVYKMADDMEIVAYEVISDGKNDWLLGLVKPREK
ncbi:MAG TPA: hypothetical protein VMV47_15160 [Bacteroidales bacterium]|nr:hypothetical protein [Bacteroidales bacterium]